MAHVRFVRRRPELFQPFVVAADDTLRRRRIRRQVAINDVDKVLAKAPSLSPLTQRQGQSFFYCCDVMRETSQET